MAVFNFTLLVYLSLVLAVAASSTPNTFGLHRRDHAELGRIVKKRMPIDILGGESSTQGQQAPSSSPAVQSQGASTPAQTTPVTAQTSSVVVSASSSSFTSDGSNLLSSVVGGLLSTDARTTSATLATTSSSASSSSSNTPQTSLHASTTPATTPSQSILYLTSGSTPTPTQTGLTSSSSGMPHAAMTALVVIAASVGASVIVWTIIRKWKFRPSSDFEGRMQPIDWQPGGSTEDAGLPGQHRPLSRASSFHSGSGNAHPGDPIRGPVGGYGASALNPIPDHDFTAGPAHLAPVGGYADLSRGPSLQPMMQESFGGAPSIYQPIQYDQHGVPLHHGYNGY